MGVFAVENRAEYGESLFRGGCTCAQAVVCAYADRLGIDESTLLKLSGGFGGGMGRMREVCGAVSGMIIVAGLLYGTDKVGDREAKSAHYKLIQELASKFRAKNGSIVCRELLGLKNPEGSHVPEERTAEYYKKRPCAQLVRQAVEILEEYGENLNV